MSHTPTYVEIATAKSPMPDEYLELLEAGFEKFLSEPPAISNMFVSSMMVRIRKEQAINSELVAALKSVLADIHDYETVNKLSRNPGREDCWQSVTNAKAALAKAGVK